MVIVDIHTHFHSRALEGQAGKMGPRFITDGTGKTFWQIGERQQAAPASIYDAEERIRFMDEAGVDVHVLASSPKWFLYNHIHGNQRLSAETYLQFCKVQNDDLARLTRDCPGRFVALATLPLMDIEASLRELQRSADDLGMRGVIIDSTIGSLSLDAPELYPLYERLEADGLLLFVHPSPLPDPRLSRLGLRWMIGFCFDETYAMACLVFGGVMDKFPRLKVVISHGGGAAPYLIGRLLEGPIHRGDSQIQSKYPFGEYLRRFYYDSCTYHPASLEYLASLVGYDRILFGTNFPGSPELAPKVVNEIAGIAEDAKRQVLGENACAVLGIRRE